MSDDLSALISTRICHDLINPLGAISNGMELLTTIAGQKGPEIDLVAESAERATAKLNYFRIAFGNAEHDSEVKGASLHQAIQHMFAVGRFKVVWAQDLAGVTRANAKLMLLLILAAESSMPLGGQCLVTVEDGVKLSITGPRLAPSEDDWDVATGAKDPSRVTASTVHFAAIADTLKATGRRLTWSLNDDVLEIVAS